MHVSIKSSGLIPDHWQILSLSTLAYRCRLLVDYGLTKVNCLVYEYERKSWLEVNTKSECSWLVLHRGVKNGLNCTVNRILHTKSEMSPRNWNWYCQQSYKMEKTIFPHICWSVSLKDVLDFNQMWPMTMKDGQEYFVVDQNIKGGLSFLMSSVSLLAFINVISS